MPGDEHYIFLAQQVELVVAAREEINRIANQNLLRYAEGEILDAYGEQFDVERRPAESCDGNAGISAYGRIEF